MEPLRDTEAVKSDAPAAAAAPRSLPVAALTRCAADAARRLDRTAALDARR